MSPRPNSLAMFMLIAGLLGNLAAAHSPTDFLEVSEVAPAIVIDHEVELKTIFDQQRIETKLVGPTMFSRAVGGMNRPVKSPRAYLSWYKIDDANDEPIRDLTVLDMVRGSSNKQLKITTAEFLLMPAQVITTGTPDEVPAGLDMYKAYRIVDASSLDREIELMTDVGKEIRQIGKPVFVCIPTRQWHHDEFVDASHPNDCFVVYDLNEGTHSEKFSTIDPFGLNELQVSKSRWICVRAALLHP